MSQYELLVFCVLTPIHCFDCKCTSIFAIQFLNGQLAEVDTHMRKVTDILITR